MPMHPAAGFFVSLVMPWRAAGPAWRETGFVGSLLIHAIGVSLFLIGLIVLNAALWGGNLFSELGSVRMDELLLLMLFFSLWAVGVELGFALLAIGTSAWGASSEPLGQSLTRSLCRWYQLTPFIAAWTLGLIVAMETIDELRWDDFGGAYGSPSYALQQLIFGVLILASFSLYCGVGGWFVLRTLAIHSRPDAALPKCRWPPVCETCGYPILGLTLEQTCPECGRCVGSSLNSPRTTEQTTTFQKMRIALINPKRLGDLLQIQSRTPGAAHAMTITALGLLFTGPIGVAYVSLLIQLLTDESAFYGFYETLQSLLVGGFGAGLGIMVAGVMLMLGVGSIVGLIERFFGKRNSLPAACQAACYAGGYVVLMAILMFGLIGTLAVLINLFSDQMNFGLLAFVPLGVLVTMLLLAIPYLLLVLQITRRARFANA